MGLASFRRALSDVKHRSGARGSPSRADYKQTRLHFCGDQLCSVLARALNVFARGASTTMNRSARQEECFHGGRPSLRTLIAVQIAVREMTAIADPCMTGEPLVRRSTMRTKRLAKEHRHGTELRTLETHAGRGRLARSRAADHDFAHVMLPFGFRRIAD